MIVLIIYLLWRRCVSPCQPSIHPCADGLTHSDSTAKRHFFHSGIKFAGSLETARNVTLPIIPWSLRQAGSLMARLENAAPSSSCHCKLSREPWIIRPFCLRQHYRARRVPWEPSPSAPRIFLPPPEVELHDRESCPRHIVWFKTATGSSKMFDDWQVII